jgi:hypothetical protein
MPELKRIGSLFILIGTLGVGSVALCQSPGKASESMPMASPGVSEVANVAGSADKNLACHAATEFIARVSAGDAEGEARLFADEGVFMGMVTRHGPKQILDFNKRLLPARPLKKPVLPTIVPYGAHDCFIELQRPASSTPDAIDHFTVNDEGKITRFIAYFRPEVAAGFPQLLKKIGQQ